MKTVMLLDWFDIPASFILVRLMEVVGVKSKPDYNGKLPETPDAGPESSC